MADAKSQRLTYHVISHTIKLFNEALKTMKMKQPDDNKIIEIAELSVIPAKRGRKPLGSAPMSVAERKRRSLALQRERGGLALNADSSSSVRIPIPFSTTLDGACVNALQHAAKEEGVTVYEILERIITESLIYKK